MRTVKAFTKLEVPFVLALFLSGCAGPTTPFGAYGSFFLKSAEEFPEQAQGQTFEDSSGYYSDSLRVEFFPSRQNLHSTQPFTIRIHDAQGISLEHHQLQVFYDGLDVTERFRAQSRLKISKNERDLEVTFRRLYLDPLKLNRIEILYARYPNEEPLRVAYLPPVCNAQKTQSIQGTENFSPPVEWIDTIETTSKYHGFNPSLVAGLIAQESSFNPKALSWAKALGLTQVTPIADREIASIHEDWPRSEKILHASYPELRVLLRNNQISPDEDWRLDPNLSIQGGLTYLSYIEEYWLQRAQRALLEKLYTNDNIPYSEIYLASYNSGPARVAHALRGYGRNFLDSPTLREAKRYVRRVTSYCYHFASTGGSAYEDPT